jgi:hypothetical protein
VYYFLIVLTANGRIVMITSSRSQEIAPARPGQSSRRVKWSRKIRGEPALAELLGDPCLHALLKSDGLTLDDLRQTISAARIVQRGDHCCLAA